MVLPCHLVQMREAIRIMAFTCWLQELGFSVCATIYTLSWRPVLIIPPIPRALFFLNVLFGNYRLTGSCEMVQRVPCSLQSTSTISDIKIIAIVYHNYRTVYSDIVHYQNQEIDSILLLTRLQTLFSLHHFLISIHVCAYSSLPTILYIPCINVCNKHHSRGIELFHHHH